MQRRRFLAGVGGVAVLPLLWGGVRASDRPVRVRYWTSPGAADVADHARLAGYVKTALEPAFSTVDVSYGGVVPVDIEHGSEVMRTGEWPLRLLVGNRQGNGPVADANLLLTDGPLGPDAPGFARGPFASIGGASHLDGLPERESVDETVRYDSTMYTAQLFLHELGHVFGLDHEHGRAEETEDGTIASPMVSGYAWQPAAEQFSADQSHCGVPYPDPDTGNRYLSMSFSPCAVDALRRSASRL